MEKETKTTKTLETPVEETKTVKTKTTKAGKKAEKMLKITLIKSTIGCIAKQKRTIEALGLKKIRSFVIKPDNACTRGMIFVVRHLVAVEDAK